MGLHAAEQLVTELAAERVGANFATTEYQKELNIPAFLVYLFGIVIAEDEYQRCGKDQKLEASCHFSPNKENRFIAFQKKYFDFAKNASVHDGEQRAKTSSSLAFRPYKLTARILPSNDQQAIVNRDLLSECEKLEALSNKALEALLIEESSSTLRHASRKRKDKKQKIKDQPTTDTRETIGLTEDKDGGKEINSIESESLALHSSVDEFVAKNLKMSTTRDAEAQKGSSASFDKASGRSTTPVVCDTESGNSVRKDEGLMPIQNSLGDRSHEDQVENFGRLIHTLSSPPLLPSNNTSRHGTAGNHVDIHYSPVDSLELTKQSQRVLSLERDLAEANRRLVEERLAHNRALREEKERCENLIRALQLRLFISENKLRTHEEALEKHIQAISVIDGVHNSTREKDEDGRIYPHNSPTLISKVLENSA